jgi:hypothetical protein
VRLPKPAFRRAHGDSQGLGLLRLLPRRVIQRPLRLPYDHVVDWGAEKRKEPEAHYEVGYSPYRDPGMRHRVKHLGMAGGMASSPPTQWRKKPPLLVISSRTRGTKLPGPSSAIAYA